MLVIAALLATGLAACGGGDSDDSTASAGATSTRGSTATTPEDQGSGSAAFRTPGGDNSIQDFGEEANSAELAAASAVLTSYLKARVAGDWAAQCTELAKSTLQPLEQLASRSAQFKGKGCAAVLEALVGQAAPSALANPLSGYIASLRLQDDRGFALFHGHSDVDYFMPMVKEDGEWKVGAIAPSEFP